MAKILDTTRHYLVGQRALALAPYCKVWLDQIQIPKYRYAHDRVRCTLGTFATWLAVGVASHNTAVEIEITAKKFGGNLMGGGNLTGRKLPFHIKDWHQEIALITPSPGELSRYALSLDSLKLDKFGSLLPAVATFLRIVGY